MTTKNNDSDEKEVVEPYNPSNEERDYIAGIYDNFDTGDRVRKVKYPELDDLTPMEYVDESRMRVAGYVPKTYEDEYGPNQGANVFINLTRVKRNIIGAFIAAQRPRAEIGIYGHNAALTDKRIATISSHSYDHYMLLDNSDETYLDWQLETLDTGLGILHEYYDYQEVVVKTITGIDWETGKKTYKKSTRVIVDRPRSKVIPFEHLYFPTMYETDLQNYPWIIYREHILRENAEQIYGKFSNWKHVPRSGMLGQEGQTGEQFFYNRWSDRVDDGYVEIIHRYRKSPEDIHDILVNGVLMTDMDNPIMYDHKNYPFISQYYEKIKGFIIGKSLPMKMFYAQDTYNDLFNSNLNRSKSSSHVSFMASMESQIEQDSVGTWEIIKTDDDAKLQEFKVQSVSSGDIEMLRLVSDAIDEATVDKSMSGQISGETATAIMNAVRQSIQNLGPQLIYNYRAVSDHAVMRLQNIFQFVFNKDLKGEHFEYKDINIEDVKLSDGQKGIMIIRVIDGGATKNCKDKCKKPTQAEHNKEILDKALKVKKNPDGTKKEVIETNYEIVRITPDDIADIQSKIKVVPNSSLPNMKSLDKALLIELINAGSAPLMQAYPDFLGLWRLLVEQYNYNPDDLTKEQDVAAAPGQQQQQADQSMAMAPQAAQQGGGQQQKSSALINSMTQGSSPTLNQAIGNVPSA